MPGGFVLLALSFDIVKWIQFIVSTEKSNMKIAIANGRIKVGHKFAITLIITSFFIYFILQLSFLLMNISSDKPSNSQNLTLDARNVFMVVLFMLFMFLYLIVFGTLINRLKLNFPFYFKQHIRRLFFFVFAIVLCLNMQAVFRVFTMSEGMKNFMRPSLEQNNWDFPLFLFSTILISNFIPYAIILHSVSMAKEQRH